MSRKRNRGRQKNNESRGTGRGFSESVGVVSEGIKEITEITEENDKVKDEGSEVKEEPKVNAEEKLKEESPKASKEELEEESPKASKEKPKEESREDEKRENAPKEDFNQESLKPFKVLEEDKKAEIDKKAEKESSCEKENSDKENPNKENSEKDDSEKDDSDKDNETSLEKEAESPSKRINAAIVAGIVAGIVAAALYLISSGLFVNKHDRILSAMDSTGKDCTRLYSDIKLFDIADWIVRADYSAWLSTRVDDVSISGEYRNVKGDRQLSLGINVHGIPEIKADLGLTRSDLRLHIPMLSGEVYTYDHTSPKKGIITEYFKEEEIEAFDNTLGFLHDRINGDTTFMDESKAIILDKFKSLEISSVPKERFVIDGREKSCEGYSFTAKEADIKEAAEAIRAVALDSYGELRLFGDISVESVFEKIINRSEEMGDVQFWVYLCNGKIACIRGNSDSGDFEIVFHGGETRTDSFELNLNSDENSFRFSQTCNIENGIYDYGYRVDAQESDLAVFDVKYDSENSVIDFIVNKDEKDLSLRCSLETEEDYTGISFEDSSVFDGNITLHIRKGKPLIDISGKPVDIGNMEREDLEEIIYEHIDEIEEFLYKYDLDYIIYDTINAIDISGFLKDVEAFRLKAGAGIF